MNIKWMSHYPNLFVNFSDEYVFLTGENITGFVQNIIFNVRRLTSGYFPKRIGTCQDEDTYHLI